MEPSELPPFPSPESPPPTPTASPAGRGTPLFLQALFLLAFWPAIYFTHEHTAAMLAAEQKIREKEEAAEKKAREREEAERIAIETELKREGVGRWESTHGDGAVLELADGRFILIRKGEILLQGKYRRSGSGRYVLSSASIYSSGYDSFPCQVNDDKLELDLTLRASLFKGMVLPKPGIVRFKRLK